MYILLKSVVCKIFGLEERGSVLSSLLLLCLGRVSCMWPAPSGDIPFVEPGKGGQLIVSPGKRAWCPHHLQKGSCRGTEEPSWGSLSCLVGEILNQPSLRSCKKCTNLYFSLCSVPFFFPMGLVWGSRGAGVWCVGSVGHSRRTCTAFLSCRGSASIPNALLCSAR